MKVSPCHRLQIRAADVVMQRAVRNVLLVLGHIDPMSYSPKPSVNKAERWGGQRLIDGARTHHAARKAFGEFHIHAARVVVERNVVVGQVAKDSTLWRKTHKPLRVTHLSRPSKNRR